MENLVLLQFNTHPTPGMVDFEKFAIIEIEINRIKIFFENFEIDIYRISFSGFVFQFRYNFENIEKL